jgi:hypothetical protein
MELFYFMSILVMWRSFLLNIRYKKFLRSQDTPIYLCNRPAFIVLLNCKLNWISLPMQTNPLEDETILLP